MKKNMDLLGIFLALFTGAALLAMLLVRTFFPRMILPLASASSLVLLTLAALVVSHYLSPAAKRQYPLLVLYAALVFGLLPWCACYAPAGQALLLALLLALKGAAIVPITAWLFDAAVERFSSGPASRLTPLVSAAGLYLAAQCLMGIL